jgi:hypothetical protein
LERHYQVIRDGGALSQAMSLADDYLDAVPDFTPEVIDLVRWMYLGYVEQYGTDKHWQIEEIEARLDMPLFKATADRPAVHLAGRLDMTVIDMAKRRWLVDHKSGKDLPKRLELDLHDQFTVYQALLRYMGTEVWGVIHSAARTQRNKTAYQPLDERFQRTPMVRTEQELDNVLSDVKLTVETMYPADGRPVSIERHTDPDRCRWMCSYTEPCLLGRKTDDPLNRTRQFLGDIGYRIGQPRYR